MTLSVQTLTGADIAAALDDLARLRIAVFAKWPYLYTGDAAYEADYLRAFASAEEAGLVLALDDGRIVGAATASPMTAQEPELTAPLIAAGRAIDDLFYFGESVLLPAYRGRGIGHAFFDHREAHARRCGATSVCFASIVRPADHPSRPSDYVPHDAFWRKRGYAPVDGLVAQFAWRDHGEAAESPKPMQYWMRTLS